MKNKNIIILVLVTLVLLAVVYFFNKNKTKDKESQIRNKEVELLKPEIGKKKLFYTDVFLVKNIDLVPHIILTSGEAKNLIVDSNYIHEVITPYGFLKPITEDFKKVSLEFIPEGSQFTLVEVEANKLYTDKTLGEPIQKGSKSNVDVTLEDDKQVRSKMSASSWSLDTNSALPSFESSMIKDDNVRIFKDRAKIYKANPKASLLVRYCGSSTMVLSEKDIRKFNVQERMNDVFKNVFNPNEIESQMLPETNVGGVNMTCYNLKINDSKTFLKVFFILPRIVYGYWSK